MTASTIPPLVSAGTDSDASSGAAPSREASPELGSAASDLRMATFRLARRLRAQRAVDSMSDGQFAVLAALTLHGAHTLGELADRERVTAPSMNRTVNGLEANGYLTRTPADDDRRKVIIALTERGRAVVEETVRRRDAWLDEALAELSDDERAALAAAAVVMRKVAER
jgi:DNA-binding MarR family transcriptional regulator